MKLSLLIPHTWETPVLSQTGHEQRVRTIVDRQVAWFAHAKPHYRCDIVHASRHRRTQHSFSGGDTKRGYNRGAGAAHLSGEWLSVRFSQPVAQGMDYV